VNVTNILGMNITTKLDQEIWHNMQQPGAYEWWYFDAEDKATGISFVLIWFSGFPFSPYYTSHYERWKRTKKAPPLPANYSGFSFQLYEHGSEILNFIREGSQELFESSGSDIGVRFENNRFTYDALKDEYVLDIDFLFPVRKKKVTAALRFKPSQRIRYEKKDANNADNVAQHQWLLCVPKAEVTGTIRIVETQHDSVRTILINATGYHDHNLGTMPMQEYISQWYWGRAFSERYNLIYYVIFFKNNNYRPLTLVLLQEKDNENVMVYDSLNLKESQFKRGLFAPLHSMSITLDNDAIQLHIHHHKVLDAGPFYLRFGSNITFERKNKEAEEITGISEFLNPQRLQSKAMRFFTKSRIWRDGTQSIMYSAYNTFKSALDWNNR